ncbi:aminotransferase class V-fold PLP-dependent enzyme [Amycolatopsis jiangsuensis]|uniref:L-seryl-tRNA(Ser) seleniumtransferase n=1 Tax=Amycolatopsis jiangsuensis TaxID=1181879 RepID=A0A840J0W6_9PSEU|nr:beta-eliminating lyase-related protein [Amycolatopsis jiangsuensis]MBB4688741.1 L-seryl-tRNA(Ser) seleniumtransferase [Amycolatopsis jiangsuensis]
MTGIHDRYGLTAVVNARGTFTPLGVSRSSAEVAAATGEALSEFFVLEELKELAERTITEVTGAPSGTVVHCASAGITLAVAATMTGVSPSRIAALPDTTGLPSGVVLPAGHAVDYGHPITQDILLAGATPVLAGRETVCSLADLREAVSPPDVACLLLVSSRLTRGEPVSLPAAVAVAHRRGIPVIVDGAAQDFRIEELLGTGADLVIVSGQKYLGSPTAGLVLGRAEAVRAVRAQEKGIGRAMKPSKEAILGVVAALRARHGMDRHSWERHQHDKVVRFTERAGTLRGVTAEPVADPTGLPVPRARLTIDADSAGLSATGVAEALAQGAPPIWVMTQGQERGELTFELVPLTGAEIELILDRLAGLLPA